MPVLHIRLFSLLFNAVAAFVTINMEYDGVTFADSDGDNASLKYNIHLTLDNNYTNILHAYRSITWEFNAITKN